MQQYLTTIEEITHHMFLRLIPIILGLIVVLGIIIYCIVKKIKIDATLVIILSVGILCSLYPFVNFVIFDREIKRGSYEVYTGKFEYSEVLSIDGEQIDLLSEPFLTLNSMSLDLDSGVYNGKIVYTKTTKWVLHVEETSK